MCNYYLSNVAEMSTLWPDALNLFHGCLVKMSEFEPGWDRYYDLSVKTCESLRIGMQRHKTIQIHVQSY